MRRRRSFTAAGAMEMPLPPDDQELRNVIDKLAQFVARNGPEFEMIFGMRE